MMNARKIHAKPLVVAIAGALCLGMATGAWAGVNAPTAVALGAKVVPVAKNDTQATQTTSGTGTANQAKKKKQRLSAKEKQAQELATIQVTGYAGSQLRDLVLKRYAPQIEDSITAVNIGQLPAVTISGALARIPGVQIGRSGGEGSTISVNGLPEVAQTLNGGIFLSPGGGSNLAQASAGTPDLASGQPDFVDIPATMFKGVDVIKSIMASDIAGGVSAIVNLRTYTPFDFKKGWTFNGAAQTDWGSLVKGKYNKTGSFLLNYHNDRWGGMLTGSYSTETIANEYPKITAYQGGVETTEADVGFNWNGGSTLGSSLDPNQVPKDYYYQWTNPLIGTEETQRKRTGLDGAFEFKLNDSLELLADAMYTKMDTFDTMYSYQLQDDSTAGGLQPGPIKPVITPQGMFLKGIQDFDQLTQFTDVGHGPSVSLNTNVQLKFNNGGLFSGELRWLHGSAHRDYTTTGEDSNANQGSLLPLPDGTTAYDNPNGVPNGVPVYQDYTGKYPSIYIMEDVTNPAQWVLTSAYAAANKINADMNVFRGDGTLHFDTGILDSFQFGARYEKERYVYNQFYYETPLVGACADPLGPGPYDSYFRFIDPRVLDACNGFSEVPRKQLDELPPGWLTYINNFDPVSITGVGESGRGYPGINADVMRDPVTFLKTIAPEAIGDPKLFQQPGASYAVDEKIEAIYGQFNLSGQVGSIPWRANAGIRGVRTNLYIESYLTNTQDYIGNGGEFNGVYINQGGQVNIDHYTSWLPAVNIAFNVTQDQILRFAFNKTQARQALSNLGEGLQIFYTANGNPPIDPTLPQNAQLFSSATSGNPHLQPYRSKNYNVSYGWYFNPHSLVYLGAFFMDVSSFPTSATERVQLADADGVVRRSGPLSTIVNGGGSIIKGLEAEFRTQFTFLPGWLSGFGVNASYTYLTSTNNGAAGASDTYNATLFWQKHGLQFRVNYNWASRIFDYTNSDMYDTLNIYTKPEGYLDASAQYDVNKHVALVFDATNLTNAYDPRYVEYPDAFYSDNISGRRYYAGVRVKFF